MKKILKAPFLIEMQRTADNMYRLGWDERNGGNISYILEETEVKKYINLKKVIRVIPISFDATELANKIFIVTGSGKYFKNISIDPENNLGIIRISKNGKNAELLWGFKDGGTFTSEFSAHMMSHIARLKVDKEHKVIMHTHPTNTLAMNFVHELDDAKFSHTLWEMCTECIAIFPEGVGVLPWMLCGTNSIGEATSEKFKNYRIVIWGMHGLYGSGRTLDETFGLIETVEKAAQIYMLICNRPKINTIKDSELQQLAEYFKVNYNKNFLNLDK